MQTYGNVATDPIRKTSKMNKGYTEFRLCENQRGQEKDTTFYSVRLMKSADPCLGKGDFVKVTGKLKADSYLNREGKPTTTLLIIAFEAVKLKSATELKAAAQAKQQEAVPA